MRRPLVPVILAVSLSAGVFVGAADDLVVSRFSAYLDALRIQAGIPGLAASASSVTRSRSLRRRTMW